MQQELKNKRVELYYKELSAEDFALDTGEDAVIEIDFSKSFFYGYPRGMSRGDICIFFENESRIYPLFGVFLEGEAFPLVVIKIKNENHISRVFEFDIIVLTENDRVLSLLPKEILPVLKQHALASNLSKMSVKISGNEKKEDELLMQMGFIKEVSYPCFYYHNGCYSEAKVFSFFEERIIK